MINLLNSQFINMNIIIYIIFILLNVPTGHCLLNKFFHKRPFKQNALNNIKLFCYNS